jgi:D-sedoheptulose 7-phosphate isomerase/D-glycero-D-manno-heptose 1,7-bisphosphate phosphatase
MALAAAQALGLDLGASWVIGDTSADIGLARAVGARPLHVGAEAVPDSDVRSFSDLAAAVQFILDDDSANARQGRSSFPRRQFHDAGEFGGAYAEELAFAFRSVDLSRLAAAADVLCGAYERDSAVFACGNGGVGLDC